MKFKSAILGKVLLPGTVRFSTSYQWWLIRQMLFISASSLLPPPSSLPSYLFLDLFVFLTDVPKSLGFENKKSQINCFFSWPKSAAKVKSESFSIKGFHLRLQKLCLIWVNISVFRFLVGIKSPGLKLVRILLKCWKLAWK